MCKAMKTNQDDHLVVVEKSSTTCAPSCSSSTWQLLTKESALSLFGSQEARNRTLDLKKSFNLFQGARSWISFIKLLCFSALTIATIVEDVKATPHMEFYFAFLTRWSLLYCTLYLLSSTTLTVLCDTNDQEEQDEEPAKAVKNSDELNNSMSPWRRRLVNFCWVTFSMAVYHGSISPFYWVLPDSGDIRFSNTMPHGVIFFLVLIDGLLINRIPVRCKHIVFNFISTVAYLLWSLLQNTVIRYNPMKEEDADDDAIYPILKWRQDPLWCAGVSLFAMLVYLPACTILLWRVSLWGRRYLPTTMGNSKRTLREGSTMELTVAGGDEEGRLDTTESDDEDDFFGTSDEDDDDEDTTDEESAKEIDLEAPPAPIGGQDEDASSEQASS